MHACTRMRLPQGLRSGAPSVALRGLKPICLSAAQNADRQTSTRLTQCWDWKGGGGGVCRWSRGEERWGVSIGEVGWVEEEGGRNGEEREVSKITSLHLLYLPPTTFYF